MEPPRTSDRLRIMEPAEMMAMVAVVHAVVW
jgi:hypothetical protein